MCIMMDANRITKSGFPVLVKHLMKLQTAVVRSGNDSAAVVNVNALCECQSLP